MIATDFVCNLDMGRRQWRPGIRWHSFRTLTSSLWKLVVHQPERQSRADVLARIRRREGLSGVRDLVMLLHGWLDASGV